MNLRFELYPPVPLYFVIPPSTSKRRRSLEGCSVGWRPWLQNTKGVALSSQSSFRGLRAGEKAVLQRSSNCQEFDIKMWINKVSSKANAAVKEGGLIDMLG